MSAVPDVKLGGRSFPVPPLTIAQLRIVVPNLVKLTGVKNINILEGDHFTLMIDTVWASITVGTPGFTRANFDALPATPSDLIAALSVISDQSGMRAMPGEAPAGEATATT